MAQLTIEAMAMVPAPADDVYAALVDYPDVRQRLLTENFADYRVDAGGAGVGTELSWTLRLGSSRQLRRGKGPVWDCLVRVAQADGARVVERDAKAGLVTTWTVHPTADGRCAVRVHAEWEGPDGAGKALARAGQRLSVRQVYEGVLTNLRTHFEPSEPAPRPVPEPAAEDAEPAPRPAPEPAPEDAAGAS